MVSLAVAGRAARGVCGHDLNVLVLLGLGVHAHRVVVAGHGRLDVPSNLPREGLSQWVLVWSREQRGVVVSAQAFHIYGS